MKPSILIVEDHTMIAEYLASVLASAGFEAVQAGSLAQARSLIAQRRFDAWLCDRHLPDGEITELLGERTGSHATATPAIALTAELEPATRQRLLDAGFADALQKPCTPAALQAALHAVLADRAASAPDKSNASADDDMPVLDDDAALRICGGDRQALMAMRRLLVMELAPLQARLDALDETADTAELAGDLHRLAASAAWCGAAEVAARGAALRAVLNDADTRLLHRDALSAALARVVAAIEQAAA